MPDITSFGAHERSLTTTGSLELGNQFLAQMQASVRYEEIGDRLQTVFCYLERFGAPISNGCGKGVGAQSRASALFEAIEHYYSIFSGHYQIDAAKPLALNDDDYFLADGSPDFNLIVGSRPLLLSRTYFEAFSGNRVLYPTFLTDPGFVSDNESEESSLSEFSLKRYSTNSGIAAGASIHEALLHGLLETIERDALGIELLKTVIHKNPSPLRRLRCDGFGRGLRTICESVEAETKGQLKIWDITSDINVPVTLAGIYIGGDKPFACFGSGASLSSQYSIERAVLEALQHFHLIKLSHQKAGGSNPIPAEALPKYLRAALSKGVFYYGGGEINVTRTENNASQAESTPESQVRLIIELLKRARIEVYYRTVVEGPVWVTHVVAPGLERFHLVARGVPVLPSARGRRFLL